MVKIPFILLLLFVGRICAAQDTIHEHKYSEIESALLFQKTYSCSEGVPTQWINGVEVHGYLTLERHMFFKDSIFEEFVFTDALEGIPKSSWITLSGTTIDSLGASDTLNHIAENSKILLYSGSWRVKSDTVCLEYVQKRYYRDNDVIRDCFFYYHTELFPDHLFNCKDSELLFEPVFYQKKEFVFQNNELIGTNGSNFKYR